MKFRTVEYVGFKADTVIPPNLIAQDLALYLDDIFHEFGKLGENVEVMPD